MIHHGSWGYRSSTSPRWAGVLYMATGGSIPLSVSNKQARFQSANLPKQFPSASQLNMLADQLVLFPNTLYSLT